MVTHARRPMRAGAPTKTARSRDRLATRDDILAAVGRLLARDGFGSIGVNAVAREAGVDKVLIYRYFGGLDALLEAWGRRNIYGAEGARPGAARAGMTAADRAADFLAAYVRDLRTNPEALEVSRWELVEDNSLTRRLAQAREAAGLAELHDLAAQARPEPGLDLPSVAAIITAGILHLALRARSAPEWLGIPLRTGKGWARIERAAVALARTALGPAQASGAAPQRARMTPSGREGERESEEHGPRRAHDGAWRSVGGVRRRSAGGGAGGRRDDGRSADHGGR